MQEPECENPGSRMDPGFLFALLAALVSTNLLQRTHDAAAARVDSPSAMAHDQQQRARKLQITKIQIQGGIVMIPVRNSASSSTSARSRKSPLSSKSALRSIT